MSKKMHTGKRKFFTPKLTDAQIAEACRLLEAYEVATIPPEDIYAELRSDDYVAYMDTLMAQSRAGRLTAPPVPMGWQYYTRKGIAAALIAALLAGIAMPERVMAGYKWLVEVVEEFFEDRKTEYRYTSNADDDVEFVPMQFGYLPEGMEEVFRVKDEHKIKLLYKNDDYYFEIFQKLIHEQKLIVYGSNTEIYYTQTILINKNNTVKIVHDQNDIYFSFIIENCHFDGQTNLLLDELIEILENLEFY